MGFLDQTDKSQSNIDIAATSKSPTSPNALIWLKADSSTDLLALEIQNLNPSMLVNLNETSSYISKDVKHRKGYKAIGSRGSKSTGPRAAMIQQAKNSGQVFKNKRSTINMNSVQKFVE